MCDSDGGEIVYEIVYMNGYAELRSSAAWIDLSNRGKIRVTGADRARLLHAMSTNDIQGLNPGSGCYAYFLSAQGRILADANVFNLGDSLLLDTEPETRELLWKHLDTFIIADDATLEDETDWSALSVEGPLSLERMEALGAPVPPQEYHTVPWRRGFVARVSATGAPGLRVFLPADEREALLQSLAAAGVEEADAAAVRTVRIEFGKPRYGEDISERYLAQETNQAHAISFTKGCYLGQEIVERVRSRGQVHRKLAPLRIHATTPPPRGTKLSVDGKDVAELTSAVFSPAFGEVAALAYVRVEQLQLKAEMTVNGAEPPATAHLS